jgi:pilus assembly protein Flp/PilA
MNTLSLHSLVYLQNLIWRFRNDRSGVTLLEYSIMIGLITALVVGLVQGAGTWAQGKWTTLAGALGYTAP